jgi:hypothetical protein
MPLKAPMVWDPMIWDAHRFALDRRRLATPMPGRDGRRAKEIIK